MLRKLSKGFLNCRLSPVEFRLVRSDLGPLIVPVFIVLTCGAQAAAGDHGGPASQGQVGSRPDAAGPSGQGSGLPGLDSAKVHRFYMEGSFDRAIGILEENLKQPRQFGHHDSVFIYKHLGVMYAASEATREEGRYYMHRLLMIEPTAKIMDMYADDMIYMIFRTVQEEYEARPSHAPPPQTVRDETERAEPRGNASAPRHEPYKPSSRHVWLGAAAIAMASGALTWYYYSDNPEIRIRDHQPE